MKVAAVLCLLAASPARAEAWIDYEQLMTENAALVVQDKTSRGVLVRRIDFGNGVTVECEGPVNGARCFGVDLGPDGGAGCLMIMLSELHDVARACDLFATAEQDQILEQLFDQTGQYVAANAVPKRAWDDLRARLQL